MPTVEALEIDSRHLNARRRISVWLPPGYRTRRHPRYPVLYLNDGQNLFEPARAFGGVTWEVADTAASLIRRRRIAPLVIVGIDHGEQRRAEQRDDDERDHLHGSTPPEPRGGVQRVTVREQCERDRHDGLRPPGRGCTVSAPRVFLFAGDSDGACSILLHAASARQRPCCLSLRERTLSRNKGARR